MNNNIKQLVSRDYERLYDLVVNYDFEIPCRIDYTFIDSDRIVKDYAVVRKQDRKELSISIGFRGTTYTQADEFQLSLSKSFKTVKDMFITDCIKNNVEWFDTFTQE